jgi:hypothetical protein
MPGSHERSNITWRVGTLVCLSFVFFVGHARAQTAPEPQAKDAFTPVVIDNVTIQGANDLGADETAKLAESLKGEAYTDKWLQKLADNVKLYLQNEGFLDAKAKPTVRSLNALVQERLSHREIPSHLAL